MKRILLLFLCLWAYSPASLACDICGCGAGNYYWGMMPQWHKNMLGIRYRAHSYHSHVGMASALASQEYFQTTELWGRFYPHRKVQILAFLPYSFNRQTQSGTTNSLQGLNDVLLMGNYHIFATPTDTVPRAWKHNLWAGAGVKLPTGKHSYTEDDLSQVANPNFQLGTGSFDFVLNFVYTLRHKRAGLTIDASYKINTANKDQYLFGNRTNSTISIFYIQKLGNVGIMPYLGVYGEHSQSDLRKKYEVQDTGGYLLANTLGIEAYYKRIALGVNYQRPFQQNMANGHLVANPRLLLHLSFII